MTAIGRQFFERRDVRLARALAAVAGAIVVVLATTGAAMAEEGPGSVSAERLLPATMGIRTDARGNTWNLEQNGTLGRVGSSMVNSGLNLLINGDQFYTYQPLMIPDGEEYVLHNRQSAGLAGLLVVRRIRVLEAEGVIRYVEVLRNTTSNEISLNVTLRTQFSGNYKACYTDQGRSSVETLGPRESGLLVTPGSTQSNRAVVFSLCSPGAALRPAISSQSRYGLSFQYNVRLGAGETVCLAHAVSQVPVPLEFDRATLGELFRRVDMNRLAETIPGELRELTRNVQGTTALTDVDALLAPAVDSLEVERGRRDILAMGDETRLVGEASCEALELQADYGSVTLPFEEVIAIQGGLNGRRDGARVFLRDGQVLCGVLAAEELRFSAVGGGEMRLEPSQLDRLLCAVVEDEGQWAEQTVALIETYGGDRLAATVESPAPMITAWTSWGKLEFGLEDLLWLAPAADDGVGHTLHFRDGSYFHGFLGGESLVVNSERFGRCEVPLGGLRSLVSRSGRNFGLRRRGGGGMTASPAGDPATGGMVLSLAGDQRLVGKVADETIRVLAGSEPIAIAPSNIRRLTRVDDTASETSAAATPRFRVELWGEGVVSGRIAADSLSVRVRGETWRVPLGDLVELSSATPQLGDELRGRIGGLIEQLGDDEWRRRESATAELIGIGPSARALLESELGRSQDAEVLRRLQRILSRLE